MKWNLISRFLKGLAFGMIVVIYVLTIQIYNQLQDILRILGE